MITLEHISRKFSYADKVSNAPIIPHPAAMTCTIPQRYPVASQQTLWWNKHLETFNIFAYELNHKTISDQQPTNQSVSQPSNGINNQASSWRDGFGRAKCKLIWQTLKRNINGSNRNTNNNNIE